MNYSQDNMKIWAHRGCSYEFPENTMPAFKAACDLEGLEGIELDIQLSSDKKIVVFHDETLDRVTLGEGYLYNYTLEELQKLQFRNFEDDKEIYIPSMEEVLQFVQPYCMERGIKINIELKNSKIPYENMEEMILELVSKYALNEYILYSSFNGESLVKLKELNHTVSVGILKRKFESCLKYGKKHMVDAYHPSMDSFIAYENPPKGAIIRVWNEIEPFFKQDKEIPNFDLDYLFSIGITDIITNIPEKYLTK